MFVKNGKYGFTINSLISKNSQNGLFKQKFLKING
jgi:hypothetical protein